MPIPFQLQVTGAVTANPFPGSPGQSLQEFINLGMIKNPTQRQAGVQSVIAAVDEVLDLGSVAAGTFLSIQVLSGALSVKVTTPLATDQILPAGDLFLLSTPNPGQQITGVKLTGTADFQYIVAGN